MLVVTFSKNSRGLPGKFNSFKLAAEVTKKKNYFMAKKNRKKENYSFFYSLFQLF